MNKHVDKLFLLISDNEVLIAETNLTKFYNKVVNQGIDLNISLSTIRNKFKDTLRIYHKTETSREYYLQKVLNEENPVY
jgi:hypothetical protein